MRKKAFRIAVTAALATLLALPAAAASSTWKIDPAHSSAQFSVRHMAISTVRGEFSKLKGTIVYDDQDVTKSTVEVTIDTSTVDTREPDRDKDVRSADFLDVVKYPKMTFKSTKIELVNPGKLKVTGDLTIHGVTKSVVLNLDGPTAPIKDTFGMSRMAASATTTINRQEFGINWNHTLDNGGLVVSNEVAITLDVEMVQPLAGK
jgi:polyisoprenoid-binding protein YceI